MVVSNQGSLLSWLWLPAAAFFYPLGQDAPATATGARCPSHVLVSVCVGLVWAVLVATQVVCLGCRQCGQLDAQLAQVQSSYFFVQVLWQSVNRLAVLAGLALNPKLKLCQHLVGEARAHNEAWVASRTSEVHQAAFGQNQNAVLGVMEVPLVELGFDVAAFDFARLLHFLKTSHIDFIIEVTDIANDRFVLHLGHVFSSDDILVTGCGNVDVSDWQEVFESLDFVAFHNRLQSANRVDLSYDHAAALALKRLAAALAHVTETANDSNFTCEHDVAGAIESVDERVAATVEVVKLALGNRVVHVDGWKSNVLALAISYNRFTPVVVSSETPMQALPMAV